MCEDAANPAEGADRAIPLVTVSALPPPTPPAAAALAIVTDEEEDEEERRS